MWVFTETGFVSIVRHWDRPGYLLVRARDKQSLRDISLAENINVLKTPDNDYPYRVIVSDKAVAAWTKSMIGSIDYTNFKSRVQITRGKKYADALLKVWSAMFDVEDKASRSGRSRYQKWR